ncbi:MAG TPA: PKD domain-containing protein [Bacteroidales bacterium]
MNKNYLIVFSILIALVFSSVGLKSQTQKPTKVVKAVYFDKSKNLRDIKPVPYGMRERTWKNKVVPNHLDIPEAQYTDPNWNGTDPVLQDYTSGSRGEPTINANFGGVPNQWGVAPPDTQGDVGTDHYFQMVNLGFAIWDKEGNLLYGPADNITLWDGFPGPWSSTNDGDPVVLYDEYADRWIATQFSLPTGSFYELIAVSETNDPTGAWYRYAFEFDNMPDYPKFGVWPDGYYFTINQFSNGNFAGGGICVVDRDAMLAGDPDAEMIFFNMGQNVYSLLPSDADGAMMPPEGSSCQFVSLSTNSLRMWETNIDWDNTNNSTVSYVGTFQTSAYSNQGLSIAQPGTSQKLGTLADRLMYRLQYRNFEDYEVMVTNHTVNAVGGIAGVRWYELRNYGSGWSIYQQGTYAPSDGDNRWMGSIAMNQNGDLAIGYSVSSASTYPSIRFAGQSAANSGSGIMDIEETSIYEGTTSQTGVNRWGDYSMMSVDPSDGQTFWYTTEFSDGGWNWDTQIASFSFTQVPEADFEVNEPLIPTGESVDFTDLTTGIPTSWEWTFEGGTPATSNEQNPEGIVYDEEGTYTVTLTATNELGENTVVKEDYITVSSSLLPDVDFTASKQIICSSDTVTFIDQTQYSPIQWLWEFEPATVTFVNGTDETSQNPQLVFDETTQYTVTLTAYNLNGPSTVTENDFISAGGYVPYFLETFADLDFLDENWTIQNNDNSNTWEYFAVGGTGPDSMAAGLDFSTYLAIGQRDRLISPPFNLTGFTTSSLEFQYAYAQRMSDISDSLIIYISNNCGSSWTRIYANSEDGSGNFATHEPVPNGTFWPMEPSDWCISGYGASCITLDISAWAGSSDVQIAFETWSAYGNPVFIDNVAVSQLVGQNENAANDDQLSVYPNPGNKVFNVILPSTDVYTEVQVLNQLGQIIYQSNINSGNKQLKITTDENWKSGVYYLKVIGDENTLTKKILKY